MLALSSACSTTTATGSSTDKSDASASSTDAARTSFVASYCEAVNPCCEVKNVDACKTNMIRSLADGFTSVIGNGCLAAVSKASDVCSMGWQVSPACHPAFGVEAATATVAASGAACDGTITPNGAFTSLSTSTSMKACDGSTTYCSPTTKTCAAVIAAGAACDGATDGECGVSAYCDLNSSTCLAKKAEGAACTLSDECLSGDCSTTCVALNKGPNAIAGSYWSPVCYAN